MSFYVQRAKIAKNHHFNKDAKGIDRLVDFDYMGSAEFEGDYLFNMVKFLRNAGDLVFKEFTATTGSPSNHERTMYYCGPECFFENAVEEVNKKANGHTIGQKSKEFTGIYEAVKNSVGMFKPTNFLWFDLGIGCTPFVFGCFKEEVMRIFMELNKSFKPVNANDLRIGDIVTVQIDGEIEEVKVAGVSSSEDGDDKITVKTLQGKKKYTFNHYEVFQK